MTKYPIVLVHGLAAKDFSFCRAFGSIAAFLRSQGVSLYVANPDGVGTIARNALQLQKEIENFCAATGCEKVNIIAHSKGGLDARYMISHLNMHTRVASLTTLSTPHHGSHLSTTILKLPRWMIRIVCFFINTFYRIFHDENPDILAAAQDLTDEAMVTFNQNTPNHPSVYYQSYASQTSKANAFLVYLPYQISRYCERDETDGLVSVQSSQWGNYQGQIQGNPNHLQMVALYGTKKKRLAVAKFYLHIINQLGDMGF